jgi:hypothetical protein
MNALALHLGRQDFLCPKFPQFKILWECYVCTVHMSYLKQHAMADYNMDGIVNVLDLNSHLIWTGQFTEPFNCD